MDLEIPGRGFNWRFERSYRSDVLFDGPLGHNWEHNYERRLIEVSAGGPVMLLDGSNRIDTYTKNSDGSFNSPNGYYTNLVQNPDGTFSERDRDGMVITYAAPDAAGVARMTSMTDRNGNVMRFQYNADGLLERVIDTMGRSIDYFYALGRLVEVRDFFNRSIRFEHDSNGDLVAVTSPVVTGTPNGNDFPNGKMERYTYSTGFADELQNHKLRTITAPNEVASGGPERLNITYITDPASPDLGRVLSQTEGGTNATLVPAGGTIRYEYLDLGRAAPSDFRTPIFQTTVTDRNGNRTEYQFNQQGNFTRTREFTNRDIRPDDPEFFETRYEWNKDYELLQAINPEGNNVAQVFDINNADRFQQGNRMSATRLPDADRGGDQQFITTSSTYEPIYNQVRTMTEPRGNDPSYIPQNGGATSPARYTTTSTFDYQEGTNFAGLAAIIGGGITAAQVQARLAAADIPMGLGDVNGDGLTNQIAGNVIRINYPTVTLLPDSNQALVEGDTLQEIVELMTYNRFGQMLTMTDPEGNVDEYLYFLETDPDGDGTPTPMPADGRMLDTMTGGYLRQMTRDVGTAPERTNIRTQYRYDPVGNVTRLVDGRGIATDFFVNQLNQVVQITRAAAVPLTPSPDEPLPLTNFQYLENTFYDFNDNVVLRQVEDRGNTSNVDGNPALGELPAFLILQTGTSTGGTTTTLVDSSQNWLPNEWAGRTVQITSGSAASQVRRILSNTSNTLTLAVPWATGPLPADSGYAILSIRNPTDTFFVDTIFKHDILDNRVEILQEVVNPQVPAPGLPPPEFLRTRYRYDPNGNPVLTILPEGNAFTAIYDERDLLFRTTRGALTPPDRDPNSPTGTAPTLLAPGDPTDYNARGSIPCQCTTYRYDGNRNIIEAVDADDTDLSPANNSILGPGDRTRFVFDGFDRQTSMVDSVGNQTVYQYDPASNLVRVSRFGPVGGPSPTSDGPDVLLGPVSSFDSQLAQQGNRYLDGLVIQTGNLVNANLLDSTESLYDELGRSFQTDRVLFVNTIPTVRPPDVADGATDLGKGDLTPGDDQGIPGVAGINVLGRVSMRTEYDRNSRITFTVEDDGDVSRMFYDGADRVIRTIDPEGNTVETAYDDNNNVIETRETDIAQVPGVANEVFLTTYFYDSLDRLQRTVDNIGQTMEYRYDSRNNLVAMTDAQGPTFIAFGIRRAFAEISVLQVNAFGNVTRYFYDGISRQTRQEVVLTNLRLSTGATNSGDGIHIGATLEGIKDLTGAEESFTPPRDLNQGGGDGLIRTGFTYDRNSLQSALLDDQGNITLYLYDNLNRRVTETKGLVRTSPFTETFILGDRRVVTPTAATINNPAFIPDTQIQTQLTVAKGRIDVIADLFPPLADDVANPPPPPQATTIVYGYDPDDNILIREDENDTEVFTRFDAINRTIAVRVFRAGQTDSHTGDPIFAPQPAMDLDGPHRGPFPAIIGTSKQDYQYDGLSRLTLATDNNDPVAGVDDSTITFAFDSLSRIIEETQQIGDLPARAISSGWRADDLRSSLTYPNSRQLVYTYDDLDRLNTVTDAGTTLPIADYDYIGASRVLVRSYPQNGTRMTYLDNSGTIDVGYDGLRRPVQLRHLRADNSLIVGFTHTYDRMNNKLREDKLHDPRNDERYSYDSAYRLIDFNRPNAGAIGPLHSDWDLDGVGNWDQIDGRDRTHSSFNELLSEDGNTFGYDDNGNQTLDSFGGSDGMTDLRYEWNYNNRLRRATRDSDGAVVAVYSYDAINRRVRKVVTNGGADNNPSLDGTTDFYLDGWQEIEERNGTDALVQQYIYGIYIDEPLVLDRNLNGDGIATSPSDQRLFYHQNTLSSTFALTNVAGSIVEGYLYDAYGKATVFTGPGADGIWFTTDDALALASNAGNLYLFTGRRLDAETGLYYYRTRYLDVVQGRFIQRDPLRFAAGDVNLYRAIGNNPLNEVDPSGLINTTVKPRREHDVYTEKKPFRGWFGIEWSIFGRIVTEYYYSDLYWSIRNVQGKDTMCCELTLRYTLVWGEKPKLDALMKLLDKALDTVGVAGWDLVLETAFTLAAELYAREEIIQIKLGPVYWPKPCENVTNQEFEQGIGIPAVENWIAGLKAKKDLSELEKRQLTAYEYRLRVLKYVFDVSKDPEKKMEKAKD